VIRSLSEYKAGDGSHDVALGDLNEDGFPDLAVAAGVARVLFQDLKEPEAFLKPARLDNQPLYSTSQVYRCSASATDEEIMTLCVESPRFYIIPLIHISVITALS
jgi:hypothetical protein